MEEFRGGCLWNGPWQIVRIWITGDREGKAFQLEKGEQTAVNNIEGHMKK